MQGTIRQNLRSAPVLVGLAIVFIMLVLHVLSQSDSNRFGQRLAKPLTRLDALIYDWRFQWLTPSRPEGQVPIVIVDIDELTLKQEGWPWSREKVASLITSLEAQGVALVGFDMVFSEPGKNAADELLKSAALSASARQELLSTRDRFDGDAALSAVVAKSTVLGYMFHADGVQAGKLPEPFLMLDTAEGGDWQVGYLPDYTSNLPILMQNARAAGFFSTLPDSDGVIRRSPLILRHDAGLYTSLSLELARQYLKAPFIDVKTLPCFGGRTCIKEIHVGDRRIQTDDRGVTLVPYKGRHGSFTYVSATKVLRGDVPRGVLQGAIALVGTSALGLADLRITPLQTQYPGVEVHANLLDAILQSVDTSYFYIKPDWQAGATFFIVLLSGCIFALILPRLEPGYMLVVTLAWFAVLMLGNFALWKAARLDLPMAAILLTAFLIATFNIGFGFLRANHQRREIKAMFGQYVPAAYVDQMLMSPETVSLDGESREMTVLFSDIRGFTSLSENLSAQALKQLLNRYFTPVTEIIFDNAGTIDKYVGDMVMAFWNAPLSDARHAHHAITAALAMQKKVDELSQDFVAEGLPPIHIGVGINTGLMNVGDMGSEFRRAYTVLGDSVNLGSRLESITKFYGVRVLVGEATHAQAPEFLYRRVDRIIVKGKSEPITVYEPVCLLSEASPSRRERVDQYNEAVAYYFAQQWDEAERLLLVLQAQDPERQLYQVFLGRINELRKQPEMTISWSGVYEHKSK